MFSRFFRYIRALLMGKLDDLEDPEVILDDARREMKEIQIKNREATVQAVTQKNNLQNMVADAEKEIAALDARAVTALKAGNRDLARQFLREKGARESTIAQLKASLEQALQASEAAKVALQRQEEQLRVKTAEALALKARWKQAKIQVELNKALDTLQSSETGQSWERATERIRNKESEAAARAEVAQGSIQSKIADLEAQQVDVEADRSLAELEQRLGLVKPETVAVSTETANATTGAAAAPSGQAPADDDIEQQLKALEQKTL